MNPSFFYIRVGFKRVYITRTCYPDESAHGTYLCFMFSVLVLGTCKISAFMPELGSVTFFFRDCFSCDFFRPPVGFRKSKAVSWLRDFFFVTVFPVTFFAHLLGFANPKPLIALFCDATFTS